MKRTTISADQDDLRVLEAEAERIGVSLSEMLRQTIAEQAAEIRRSKRPRFGIYRSGHGSLSEESARDEDSPAAQ